MERNAAVGGKDPRPQVATGLVELKKTPPSWVSILAASLTVAMILLASPLLAVGSFAAAAQPREGPGGSADCGPVDHKPDAPHSFMGSQCSDQGCTEQKAGFAWADRAGITDPAGCANIGAPRWQAGCRAFAEDTVTPEQYGFEWARDNDIEDRCLCQGAGPGFAAGCEAFVTATGR